MNESSTRSDNWVSISEAAAVLEISERQARRYAGRLAGHDRREAGHDGDARPALVRLEAMQVLRENTLKKATSIARPDTTPDMAPDTKSAEAGRQAGVRPDAKPDIRPDMSAALVTQLQSENVFLRSQVEAANRQAAEATAALREYLKMQAKALPSGDESSTRSEAPDVAQNRPIPTKTPTPDKVTPTVQSSARGEGLRELRAIFKKMFGLR